MDGRYAMHLRDLHFLQWLVVFSRELRVNGEVSASGAAASAAWERRRGRIRQQPQRVVASSRHDFQASQFSRAVPRLRWRSRPEAEDTTVSLSAYRLLHRGLSDMWRWFISMLVLRLYS